MKSKHIQKLTFTAVMLALSTVLSVIPAIQLPFGGKTTFASMLPVMLVVLKYDWKWGFFTPFVYSVIQLGLSLAKVLSWGLSPIVLVGCLLLDYILAYTVLVFAGSFKKRGKTGVIAGVSLALVSRYIMHLLSGMLLWDYITEMGFWDALWYSITYNATYMLPELIITLLILTALLSTKAYKKIMEY
ncbi:MAG: energy-coupled thiamine transporter ThiT [Clostridia bacterium]|nr:energy-coupled thiamine transporter ThiT [Clostridia bacterium]